MQAKSEKYPSEKSTSEKYTNYEIARIIAARALQLSMNAPILLKLSKEELEEINYDSIKIAEKEFQAGILPITIKRPKPLKVQIIPIEKEMAEEIIEKEVSIEEKKEEEKEQVAETIEEELEVVELEEKEKIEEEEEKEGFEE